MQNMIRAARAFVGALLPTSKKTRERILAYVRPCLICGQPSSAERGWVRHEGREGWLCDRCLDDGAGVVIHDGVLRGTRLVREVVIPGA